MEFPLPTPGFVRTRAYVWADKLMKVDNVDVITLFGPSGSGKSTLAMELFADICPRDIEPSQSRYIYRRFNCSKLDYLYSDLVMFYLDIDKTQKKLSSENEKTWEILKLVFRDMNTYFASHTKLFILDDAERIEEILKIMNYFCQVINMSPSLTGRWKLLVTSQRIPLNREVYVDMGINSLLEVDGFNPKETIQLFQNHSFRLSEKNVEEITNVLGQRPLILKIFMSGLQSNQVEAVSDIVQNLLEDIEAQVSALDLSDQNSPVISALVGVKVSIERLVEELPHKKDSLQLIKLLSLLNERNIPMELLVACAETYNNNPKQAAAIARNLMNRLMERGICTKRSEGKSPLFRLHQLVKQSMMLFVREEEKASLIEHALVALTRVMPKDGRKHQTRLVGFYVDHGKSLDAVIRETMLQTKFVLLLHCRMLTSMGYCHLAQRTGDYREGVNFLQSALNKFCHLVQRENYDCQFSLRSSEDLRADIERAQRMAQDLFVASDTLDLRGDESYQQYIKDLPLYHQLTEKDLANMVDDSSAIKLVNKHLTRDQLQELDRAHKVLKPEKLQEMYLAEVLAQIYRVWSTLHRKWADIDATVDPCIIQSEAAIKVFSLIYEHHHVYLLAGLITEREMLATKLPKLGTAGDVKKLEAKFDELSAVGDDKGKNSAYEAGLMRSDLSRDKYHKLLCKESVINCKGYAFELTGDEQFYEEGKRLFEEVEFLAERQVNSHSTLSYSFKNYAAFLFKCKKYGDAVVHILRAMLELHRFLLNGDSSQGHPEFSHPRFKSLYSCLERYYDEFCASSYFNKEGRERLLKADMQEVTYLGSAITSWNILLEEMEDEVPFAGENLASPTEEGPRALHCLEAIHQNEIAQVGIFSDLSVSPFQ